MEKERCETDVLTQVRGFLGGAQPAHLWSYLPDESLAFPTLFRPWRRGSGFWEETQRSDFTIKAFKNNEFVFIQTFIYSFKNYLYFIYKEKG